jgi:hypothetical protein
MNRNTFITTVLRNPVNEAIVDAMFSLALPDAWLVSGCLVQTAWNALTGRACDYGIRDYDIFYFDPDTSWQAEDAVIRRLQDRLTDLGAKIEIRNQARVHLWYAKKHGFSYPALRNATEGIDRFPTKTTQVGICRSRTGHELYAPEGLDDVAQLIVRPNPSPNFSAAGYTAKAMRWKELWPELTIVPADPAD